jgi:hypothetical protein
LTDLNVTFQTASYLIAALSFAVTCAYYIMNLNNNKKNQELALKAQQQSAETRQAQLFMQIFNRYQDEQFWNSYRTVLGGNWKSYDDWRRDMVGPFGTTFFIVGSYLEGIGVLVRRGLVSIDMVNDILGGPTVMFWNKIGEYAIEHRLKGGYPEFGHDLEFLYNEFMKLRSASFKPNTVFEARSTRDAGVDV